MWLRQRTSPIDRLVEQAQIVLGQLTEAAAQVRAAARESRAASAELKETAQRIATPGNAEGDDHDAIR